MSINNASEDPDRNLPSGQKTAVHKAYDLVSQMLLESDNINLEKGRPLDAKSGIKRLGHDTAESPQTRTPDKKRKIRNKVPAKGDILATKDRESDIETLYYGTTLAPESKSSNERATCSDKDKETVPEILCSQYPIKFSGTERSAPQLGSTNTDEKTDNVQTTPKKRMLQAKVNRRSSPILGGCNRKSTYKITHCNNYNMTAVDSPDGNALSLKTLTPSDECVTVSNLYSYKGDVSRSPSLLKIEAAKLDSAAVGACKAEDNGRGRKTGKREQDAVRCVEDNRENVKNIEAGVWKLKPVPNANINMKHSIDVGSRKLKQTTLAVASCSKKQDLCRLKEFNGGVRQNRSVTDEEIVCKLAVQESLNEDENTELGSSENRNPGVTNRRTDSTDDDDLVLASPVASCSRTSPRRKCVYARDRPSFSR